jgi:hypothetical protein
MNVSRELAIQEMKGVISLLEQWIGELEDPRVMKGDMEVQLYPEGVPPFLSVLDIKSIPIPQLRAELAVAAAKLEAIAST